jgi:hypothetical protein
VAKKTGIQTATPDFASVGFDFSIKNFVLLQLRPQVVEITEMAILFEKF